MIVEERTYSLHPGKVREYMNLFERNGADIYLNTLKSVVGVFTTEVGTLNQVVTMATYETFEERNERRTAMRNNPDWEAYASSVRPLLVKQESRLLIPASFSPLR